MLAEQAKIGMTVLVSTGSRGLVHDYRGVIVPTAKGLLAKGEVNVMDLTGSVATRHVLALEPVFDPHPIESGDPDGPCLHPTLGILCNHVYLEDSNKHQAEMRMHCVDCGEDMLWPEGIVMGVSLSGVARNLDRKELRIAITPASEVLIP